MISKRSMTVANTAVLAAAACSHGSTVSFQDPSGLAAEATFSLASGGSVLQIAFRNTSTGAPASFDSASRLLTSIAFNLSGPQILPSGSTVHVGAASTARFDSGDYTGGSDVSSEWGGGKTSGLLSPDSAQSAMRCSSP
jgi:hypothetical protein